MRRACTSCAERSERWVTLHAIAWGHCADCDQHGRLHAVRETAPNALVTTLDELVPNRAAMPWRCPCCEGSGQLPRGLLRPVTVGWHGFEPRVAWFVQKTDCLECGGRGVVWAENVTAGETNGA